jgi:hypothetical protein
MTAKPEVVVSLQFEGSCVSGSMPRSWIEKTVRELHGERIVRPPRLTKSATFQDRVAPWMMACFGPEISRDTTERNHRFLEESIELVQACGCTREDAHALVDYVFDRPVGEPWQETGGVSVTLAALCLAHGIDMHAAADEELARIWQCIAKIRAKQAAKPKGSPLPEAVANG